MKKANLLSGITAIVFAVMLAACPNPDTNTGGGSTTSSVATISGTVTVDDESIDITAMDIILTFYGDEKQRLKPNADGTYTFTKVEKNTRAWFQVKAVLAGFESAYSLDFALIGDYTVEVLNISKIPPSFTELDFKEDNVLTITFNGPVEIESLAGFKIETNLSVDLYATGFDCVSEDFDVWEITMNRSLEGYEKISVNYDSSTKLIKEKGTKRFLHSHWAEAKMSFTAVMPLEASVISTFMNMITLVWNKDVDLETVSIDGWTITVDGDELDIKIGAINTKETTSISISGYSLTKNPGDVLTISYDASLGTIKAADGGILKSFTEEITL